MLGLEYKNRKGDSRPAKEVRIMEDCRCRFKCATNIPAEKQASLLKEYLSLADTARQKAFLSSFMKQRAIERKRPRSEIPVPKRQKSVSRFYYLLTENQEEVRVCLKFFTFTFQVSHKYLDSIIKNRTPSNAFLCFNHKRCGVPPSNATSRHRVEIVKMHIRCIPAIPSHYCRRDSRQLYLSPELNLKILYRLYLEYVSNLRRNEEEVKEPVSQFVYQSIFNRMEPPTSFHRPKKDQCSRCIQFNENPNPSEMQKKLYNAHKERECQSLDMKKEEMNSEDDNARTVTFDLESTLLVPSSPGSQLYYKRKLKISNFTLYDSKRNGNFYVFDEVNGHKGCSEIATCILHYIRSIPATITTLNTWSDTCAAQSRNHYLVAAMIYAVNSIEHLQQINMKYLESGHSLLECDSMHSAVEMRKKHRKIFTTDQMKVIIEDARVNPFPYNVTQMSFTEFFDMKDLAKKFMKNYKLDSNFKQVQWLNIKWLQVNKNSDTVRFKYKYHEDFSELNFSKKPTRRPPRAVTVVKSPAEIGRINLKRLYYEKLQISAEKKKDLTQLLKDGIIPPRHESFYSELPSNLNLKDTCNVIEKYTLMMMKIVTMTRC